MKSYGALRRSLVEQVLEQVGHRHQLSAKERSLLRCLVFDSLSKEVRVPEQHAEAFHDATVMLQSAGHLIRDPQMCKGTVKRIEADRTAPPTGRAIQERRRYARTVVNWPLTIKTPQGPVAALMRDISAGGAFVYSREPFQLDDEFPLTDLHVRSSRLRLSIGAKVVRSDSHYMDDETVSLGMGVRFTRLSAAARKLISTLVSGHPKDDGLDRRADLTCPVTSKHQTVKPDNQLVKLEIEPSSYPQVGLFWRSRGEEDVLETSVAFSRELWIKTARACEQVVDDMSSRKVKEALGLMAERILSEIEAEDIRFRYKAAYEAFFESVVEIYNRKDFDKVRKGQIIHDMASQVKLSSKR